jgi:Effector-associated domain 10
MMSSEQLNTIIERIASGTQTAIDVDSLRVALIATKIYGANITSVLVKDRIFTLAIALTLLGMRFIGRGAMILLN